MSRLTGKSIIVTGAASGIGEACASLFVSEGAQVLLADVNESGAAEVAKRLGERVVSCKLDVQNEDDWARAIETSLTHFGKIDGVGNIAGIDLNDDNLEGCTPQTWNRTLRVNLDGVFLGTKHAILAMKETGGGSIVNISSIFGLVSDPDGQKHCVHR